MKLFLFDAGGMEASLREGTNRGVAESTGLCILFMTLTICSAVSNGAVIISAILERWKEVDNFTFVFCVSLSFNHLFLALHIHSMIAYSVVANTWELHAIPCLGMGVLSLYLNSVYLLQILLLVFDSAVARYSNVRVAISVSLSKKIALRTWIIAAIPQVSPIILKTKDPYLYSAGWGGCFQSFIFRDISTLFQCIAIYLLLPLGILIVWYVVLLFQEESNRRLAITVSLLKAEDGVAQTSWRRHWTAVSLSTMYTLTTLPYIVCSLFTMTSKEKMLRALDKDLAQFANISFCFGSILTPLIYLILCPSFFQFVMSGKDHPLVNKLMKWSQPRTLSKNDSTNLPLNGPLNMIEEEEEEIEDDEDFIELPAISVQLAYQQMSESNINQSPPIVRY
jgi:hypothetical protein